MDSYSEDDTVRVEREPDGPVSEAVLEAVSEARGVSPMELDEHLFDVVDPDALDRIAEGGDSAVVSFSFAECTVQVFGSDLVVARFRPDE